MRRKFKSPVLYGTLYPEKYTIRDGNVILPAQVPKLDAEDIAYSDFRIILKCELTDNSTTDPFVITASDDDTTLSVCISINGTAVLPLYLLPVNRQYTVKGPSTIPEVSYLPGNLYILERLKANDASHVYLTSLSDLANVVNYDTKFIFPKDISVEGCELTFKQIAELASQFSQGIGGQFEVLPDGSLKTNKTINSVEDFVADYGDALDHKNVSLIALRQAFDALDIRGRNLIKNSDNYFGHNAYVLVSSTFDDYYTDGSLPGNVKYMRLHLSDSVIRSGVYFEDLELSHSSLSILVPYQADFVVSFLVRANQSTYLSVADICTGQDIVEHNGEADDTFAVTTGWSRHWVHCKHTTMPMQLGFYQDATKGVANTILDIACIKVELGNKATDWSIDPGDIIEWIKALQTSHPSKVSIDYNAATETLIITTAGIDGGGGGGGGAAIAPKPTVNPQIENSDGKVIITWGDPDNTVIDGSTVATWAGTKLVMKEDGYPASPDDGTVLVDSTTRDRYKTAGFEKSGLTNGTVYYFALFPYSTDGVYNYSPSNRLLGEPTGSTISTFASCTDEEIANMIQAHYDNQINIADYWAVGDTRTVSLSAMEATGVGESHRAQTIELVIGDFDHDDLTTPINGHTKAAVTLLQKDCLMDASNASNPVNGFSNTENGYMNSSDTNVGGWKNCERRTWCNNVYYNALPSAWKSIVKTVNKKSGTGDGSSSGTETTQDKIFLASEIEIFGKTVDSVSGEGTQYPYYKNTTSNRYKMPKWSSSYISHIYWERSHCKGSSKNFCTMYFGGSANQGSASFAGGIAPCLCI